MLEPSFARLAPAKVLLPASFPVDAVERPDDERRVDAVIGGFCQRPIKGATRSVEQMRPLVYSISLLRQRQSWRGQAGRGRRVAPQTGRDHSLPPRKELAECFWPRACAVDPGGACAIDCRVGRCRGTAPRQARRRGSPRGVQRCCLLLGYLWCTALRSVREVCSRVACSGVVLTLGAGAGSLGLRGPLDCLCQAMEGAAA